MTGLAHFYRQELTNVDWGNGVLVSIPKRYQALSFRATYSYKDTYLVEGNLAIPVRKISIKNVATVGSPLFPGGGCLRNMIGIEICSHSITS